MGGDRSYRDTYDFDQTAPTVWVKSNSPMRSARLLCDARGPCSLRQPRANAHLSERCGRFRFPETIR
jgi:hypothetical protein